MDAETSEAIWKIFMPEAARQVARLRNEGTRFAHYTSAESALAILRSGRILLRNSAMMNDFSEVQYGMNCLSQAYNGPIGNRLKKVMKDVQVDLPSIVEASFDGQFSDVRSGTYLTSISEHGDHLEDAFGRLSMWRAYANRNGVAFIFKNTPFLAETNAMNVFTTPVLYATPDAFLPFFEEVIDGLEKNIDLIAPWGGQFFHDAIVSAFRFAIQSTKHPAFREEREWRVIYTPTLLAAELTHDQMTKIPTEIMALNGVPQRVYAIPFIDYPDEGFVGATIPDLLDRVLIGPSLDAYPIAQAFISELNGLGVENARDKVVVTGVPLRT